MPQKTVEEVIAENREAVQRMAEKEAVREHREQERAQKETERIRRQEEQRQKDIEARERRARYLASKAEQEKTEAGWKTEVAAAKERKSTALTKARRARTELLEERIRPFERVGTSIGKGFGAAAKGAGEGVGAVFKAVTRPMPMRGPAPRGGPTAMPRGGKPAPVYTVTPGFGRQGAISYTIGGTPTSYNLAWSALEGTFGGGQFTRDQALQVLANSGMTPYKAVYNLAFLERSGYIVPQAVSVAAQQESGGGGEIASIWGTKI